MLHIKIYPIHRLNTSIIAIFKPMFDTFISVMKRRTASQVYFRIAEPDIQLRNMP
ncbi:MAG: hypothetical protein J6S69_01710 [Proteobacteria bacterium]|nr:hypothetical protein [Pseudomonadota bacterium]